MMSKVKIKIQSKKNNCVKKCIITIIHLYNKWIDMCKKEYEQDFENKDENQKKKYDYKSLKDFSYQVDEVNKTDVTEKEDKDETVQELPPWIKVPKRRCNEMKDVITRANESKLMTRLEKKEYYTEKYRKVTRKKPKILLRYY